MKKTVLFLLVCGLLGVLAYFCLHSSREEQVRGQLERLCEHVHKKGDEPPLDSLTRAVRTGTLFSESCQVYFDNPRVEGRFNRKELVRRISLARNSFTLLTLSFHDISIRFPEDNRAHISLTMRIRGHLRGGESIADVRELVMGMEQADGTWLISLVKEVQVLER
jgi:hypothetical protein